MGVFQNNLMGAAAAAASAGGGDFYDYQIANSCRFGVVNSYLTRSISGVTDNTQNTISFWVKRSLISGSAANGRQPVMGNSGGAGQLEFLDADTFRYASYGKLESNVQLFRDTSAWYHIHIYRSTSNGGGAIYVNGVQVSLTTNTAGSAGIFQNGQSLQIGASNNGSTVFNGYIAEVYGIYDQNIAHTEFGEFKNGVWIPKDAASAITFGSHDFYLKFESSSDLGNDSSGNNNDFTATNMSAHDQMLDSPTFNSSSNGSNFPTWNWLVYSTNFRNGMNPSYGNTRSNPNNPCIGFSTMAMTTGKKWYIEAYAISKPCTIGIFSLDSYATKNNFNANYHNTDGIFWHSNGQLYIESNLSSSTTSYNSGDVVAFAVDLESTTETVKFYKNGSLQTTKNIPSGFLNRDWFFSLSRPTGGGGYIMNAGQDSTFAGTISAGGNSDDNGFGDFKYSVPSGYLALCSGNLGISDDIDPAQTDDNYPQKQFNALLYTGDGGSSRAITGLGFQPDFVWIKRRNAAENHNLYDSNRGANKRIQSNRDVAETTEGLPAFGSDGFTVDASGGICNVSSQTYVAWNWRANAGTTSTNSSGSISVTQQVDPSGGFSISTYSGTAGTPTIGHGLSSAPTFVIVKQTNGTHNWAVYAAGAGATKYGFLESTSGFGTDNMWGNTSPTDTLVYLGAYTQTSGSGRNYVAYCFADTEGYIKSGSYEGNGNVDGAFIYTGFKPAFILIKGIDANGTGWNLHDNETSPFNVASTALQANTASAELSNYNIDMLSNGFKVRDADGDLGTNNNTYIYLAFASNPFKYATAR